MMKKNTALLLCVILMVSIFAGCAKTTGTQTSPSSSPAQTQSSDNGTVAFTDSCGRQVELPKNITRVSPCGAVAQMILYATAPNTLVSAISKVDDSCKIYYNDKYLNLPITGQFYGQNNLNSEALIQANPQVIIDMGDKKDTEAQDMDNIYKQTGIPTIFIEATINTYPTTFRTLGKLLNVQDQGEALAKYTESTLSMAKENSAKLTDATRLSVMFGTGQTGLDCNAKGSIQCTVLDAIGVNNAIVVSKVSSKGGGNTVTMEQVVQANPDVILLDTGGPYKTLSTDPYWSALKAVKDGKYYEIPNGPYHFLANPPSINQIIGIRWLGNLLYPDLYKYDMVSELQSFYKLFWHYDLSQDAAKALLANSTLQNQK